MKSKVYFIKVHNLEKPFNVKVRFERLLVQSRLLDFIRKDQKVAIKIHFGEKDNKGYVLPEYLRVVCEKLNQKKAAPFLIDTNTLYRGRRVNSQDHLKLAYEHGFTPESIAAEIVIPDDYQKENIAAVNIGQRYIKTAKIVSAFLQADAIIGVAHFKGHLMTGFGGALKNIGMGCASRDGKLAQHADVSPVVYTDKCVGCGLCLESCPVKAISLKNEKSIIDRKLCIGCASCIAACPYYAIDVDWEAGEGNIQEKMVEYAKAVLDSKKSRAVFINFAIKITKECDCLAKDDPRIVPDIGIFISQDPVSVDKASLDLVNKVSGRDIFKEVHPKRNGLKQLYYAYELGLGKLEYELIDLSE